MEVVQSSFVIVGANTPEMKVFFNGSEVTGVQDLKIDWDIKSPKVTLTLSETQQVQELKQSGISVRRSA
jgi:hypothetical protein